MAAVAAGSLGAGSCGVAGAWPLAAQTDDLKLRYICYSGRLLKFTKSLPE